MSTYKDKRSSFYSYEFVIKGNRFKGSTHCTTEREAILEERRLKESARREVESGLTKSGPNMTISDAIERYKTECSDKTSIEDSCNNYGQDVREFFGAQKRLADITDNELAQFITWKQGRPRWGKEKHGARTPASINRSTWQFLRPIFNRAADIWGVNLPKMPKWKLHRKKEAEPTIRVLSKDECMMVFHSIDSEYAEIVKFALVSGLRLESSLLKWANINLGSGTYGYLGKGGKLRQKPFTPEASKIISGRVRHNDTWVFTYLTKKCKPGIPRGSRMPITVSGLKSYWRRFKVKIGLSDFRWHDLRHTFATALLEETGNLALVQEALDHSSPEVTRKHYARIMTERLRRGMSDAEQAITAYYSPVLPVTDQRPKLEIVATKEA